MPPAQLPPTPASSTDIRGQDKLASLAPVLALPPTAYTESEDRAASSPPSSDGSDSSYRPTSPVSSAKTQRRQAAVTQPAVNKAGEVFALPPPPTRLRKIIQVQPKGSVNEAPEDDAGNGQAAGTGIPAATGGKKRGNNGNATAAGRKIARKTAHSLIERRRRSKMNEEFGVLKDMIPACNGQEMHKLAILQASIEYLRYLERCITDLKAANEAPRHNVPQPDSSGMRIEAEVEQGTDSGSDSDEEMDEDPDIPSPSTLENAPSKTSLPSLASLPSMSQYAAHNASPSILPHDHQAFQHRHYSISSTSQTSYSPYIHSTQTSPFFGPSYGGQDPAAFALTSPALRPQDAANSGSGGGGGGGGGSGGGSGSSSQRAGSIKQFGLNDDNTRHQRERREQDFDKEAMAALMMLNSDRRSWKDKSGRGMSVQDLLSG